MNKPTIEQILIPRPVVRPRIYAYSINDEAHQGLLKVGQTTRDVKQRIAEQLKTAAIKNYTIELDESAGRDDGTIFSDHEVRTALEKKGFENTELEWMRCTVEDVKTVLTELRTGQRFTGTHHLTFSMRAEQAEAVSKTHGYFHSIWKEDMHAVPRFLWNAKMRFGKTFTAYQLAKKLGAKRLLVRHLLERAESLEAENARLREERDRAVEALRENLITVGSRDNMRCCIVCDGEWVADTVAYEEHQTVTLNGKEGPCPAERKEEG